ncbi:MAG: hypothetical protein M3Y87_13645, partial [Myxococcota bacterium]|nr:hypothetical protein [Myxococcota bacterium]
MSASIDGRRFAPELAAVAKSDGEGRTVLAAPMPGVFRGGPVLGAVLAPGASLGELEVLGLRHRL